MTQHELVHHMYQDAIRFWGFMALTLVGIYVASVVVWFLRNR